MNEQIFKLLSKVNADNIWDREPVFCFTSDIDWASEDVLNNFFDIIPIDEIKLITFLTHESDKINEMYKQGKIHRGIHPNFLSNSSHGNSFKEVADVCSKLAPEAIGFRCHRLFDVTDITHLLYNDYGMKYVSNLGTTMANSIRPVLHESGLVHYPLFLEDGSHLYNQLGFSMKPFMKYLTHPGIKIISLHPSYMVFNAPSSGFMRELQDSRSRKEFNTITKKVIMDNRNNGIGIRNIIEEIIKFVLNNNYLIMSMNELYYQTMR